MKNYIIFFFMSLGVWTTSIGTSYSIVDKFLNFEENVKYCDEAARTQLAQDEGDDESDATADEVMIASTTPEGENEENEDDEMLDRQEQQSLFAQYFSATASSRSVLLQLIPGLTAFAVLSVDLSVSPIFVYSESIVSYLPPLLSKNSWKCAKSQLRRNTTEVHPSNWKVFLLSVYIYISESRLIQYFIILQINCVAFGIVFFPRFLGQLVVSLVVVTLIVAILRVGKYFVDVFDFFFPQFLTGADDLQNILLPLEEE